MAGVLRVEAKLSITGPTGIDGPFDVLYAVAVQKWTGKRVIQVPATLQGTVSLLDFGTLGLTTVSALLLVADQAISITLGPVTANQAQPLTPGAPILLSGLSLTAISLTNGTGILSNVTYALAGS